MKELVARLDVRLGGNYVATEQFGGTHTHTAICSCPLLLTHTHTYTDAGKSLRAALGYLEGAMLGFKDPGSQHLEQQHVSRCQ